MAMDDKVKEAIIQAVRNNYQSDKVADKLILWLNNLSEGNAILTDDDDRETRIKNILDYIKINNTNY